MICSAAAVTVKVVDIGRSGGSNDGGPHDLHGTPWSGRAIPYLTISHKDWLWTRAWSWLDWSLCSTACFLFGEINKIQVPSAAMLPYMHAWTVAIAKTTQESAK